MEIPKKNRWSSKWLFFLLFLLSIDIITLFITTDKINVTRVIITMVWIFLALVMAAIPFYIMKPEKMITLALSWICILGYTGITYIMIPFTFGTDLNFLLQGIPVFILISTIVYLAFALIFVKGRINYD